MDRTACTEPQCLYKGALYLYLTEEYHEEPQDNWFPFNTFISRPTEYKPGVLHNLL
jgi:hypothetical protein